MSYTRADRRTSENWVWDVDTLDWVQMTQPGTGGGGGGDASAANQITEIDYLSLISSNTGVVEDAVAAANPIGGMLLARRRDTLTAAEVSADGDNIALNATSKGALHVKHADTISVATPEGEPVEIFGTLLGISNTVNVDVTSTLSVSWVSGLISTSGGALVTPASGKKLRVYYVSYNPELVETELGLQFGSGTLFLYNKVQAGSIIAKDFGDTRYLQGGINESLNIYIGTFSNVYFNVFYTEV